MISSIIIAGALLIYPILILVGLQVFGPRVLAGLLLALVAANLLANKLLRRPTAMTGGWLLLAAALATSVTLITGSLIGLKFYPVLVNLVMLCVFAYSLYRPPTVIERFARMQEPDLPDFAVNYTRKVTWLWSGFFVGNACIALFTVFLDERIWTFYNGFLAYVFMGLLFTGEYYVRCRVKRLHGESRHAK